VQHIQQLRDPALYKIAVSVYEQLPSYSEIHIPPASDVATLDPAWKDEITAQNRAERLKLEVELKTYSNNMIKESIRVRPYQIFTFLVCLIYE